jgi:ZIP family zinc transporter
MTLVPLGFLASLAAGLATGLGAVPVLFTKRASERLLDAMLGFAAGVMLAATAFSLLIPAIEVGGIWITIAGLGIGALFLGLMDRLVPHMHFISGREGPHSNLSRIWLLIIAITIHNFPEGLSVGIGFGTGNIGAATALAIAIGLQNMPEGLAVALPLAREGYSQKRALWYATATGLIEPVGGLIGVSIVTLARPILPYGLAFAAGAMMYVVFDEMIPESHRGGHEREATFGGIIGFGLMMVLDTIFA